jgi:chemosensory pili system protein ChpC
MITSRVGEKHRARAIELGVDDYLGKPYQEASCSRRSSRWWARTTNPAQRADGSNMSSNNDRPAEIYGLMVPLDKERLLVPRGCVAEVVGYQTPQEMTGAPPWHLGVINWNGRKVPMVSFEGCCGGDVAPPTQRSRVVVLNAVSEAVESGHIAILSQGFPQLVRISPEFVKLDAVRDFPDESPIVCQLQVLDETPLVPDLDRLEAMVAKETESLPDMG